MLWVQSAGTKYITCIHGLSELFISYITITSPT